MSAHNVEYIREAVKILRQNGSGPEADAVAALLAERTEMLQRIHELERRFLPGVDLWQSVDVGSKAQ